MIETSGERESGKSALIARLDDDDDFMYLLIKTKYPHNFQKCNN